MTPDVSSVLAKAQDYAIHRHHLVGDGSNPDVVIAHDANPCPEVNDLQQAAEQVCYRYALDLLERILPNNMYPGIETVLRRLETEREAVQQLIAGGA